MDCHVAYAPRNDDFFLFIKKLLDCKKCERHECIDDSQNEDKCEAVVYGVQGVAYGWVNYVAQGNQHVQN